MVIARGIFRKVEKDDDTTLLDLLGACGMAEEARISYWTSLQFERLTPGLRLYYGWPQTMTRCTSWRMGIFHHRLLS